MTKINYLITNFQKWPEVSWFGQIVYFQADYDQIYRKKIIMTSVQWHHYH